MSGTHTLAKRFPMNSRSRATITLLGFLFSSTALVAQSSTAEPASSLSLQIVTANPLDIPPTPPPPALEKFVLPAKLPPSHFSKTRFILLSATVYAAATADMYRTNQFKHFSWWIERDPLAKPFVHLPTPAYFAVGLSLATGLNWVSWKMAHSRRFHRVAPLPQLAAIAGNLHGVTTNSF
jgi:hypothetical protein